MLSTWAYWQKPYFPGTYLCEAWIFNKAKKQNIFAEANGVPWCSFTVIYNGGILVESGSVWAKAVFADNFCAGCLLGHADVFTVLLQPLLVESAPLQWKPATRAQFRCLRGHSRFKTFVCPNSNDHLLPNSQEFHGIPSHPPNKNEVNRSHTKSSTTFQGLKRVCVFFSDPQIRHAKQLWSAATKCTCTKCWCCTLQGRSCSSNFLLGKTCVKTLLAPSIINDQILGKKKHVPAESEDSNSCGVGSNLVALKKWNSGWLNGTAHHGHSLSFESEKRFTAPHSLCTYHHESCHWVVPAFPISPQLLRPFFPQGLYRSGQTSRREPTMLCAPGVTCPLKRDHFKRKRIIFQP